VYLYFCSEILFQNFLGKQWGRNFSNLNLQELLHAEGKKETVKGEKNGEKVLNLFKFFEWTY
jgi:hypothetical protein